MEKIVWPGDAVRMVDGQMITPRMVLEYLQVLEEEIKCKDVQQAAEILPAKISLTAIHRIAGKLLLVKRRGLGEKRFPAGPTYEIANFI